MSSGPTLHKGTSKRSWSRGKNLAVGCLGGLAVLGLAAVGYLAWVNYLPPPEPERVTPPGPNGYAACLAAARRIRPTLSSPIGNFHTAGIPELRAALALDRPALDELRRSLRLPYYTPPFRSMDGELPGPEFRSAARAFAAEARVARTEGRYGRAMRSALDAMDLGGRIGRGGVVIHHLVAFAVEAIGIAAAEPCVARLSRAEAREAGARLDRILAELPTFADAMEEERRYALADLPRMVREHRSFHDETLMGPQPFKDRLGEQAYWYLYPKSWTGRDLDRYYRTAIAELRKPYRLRAAVPVPDGPYLDQMVLAPQMSGFQSTLVLAELRLLRGALALQEYRQKHHRYPDTWKELVQSRHGPLPPDPFTEQPFVYRREGSGYLLYSLGPDGKDDGGVPMARLRLPDSSGDLVAGRLFSR